MALNSLKNAIAKLMQKTLVRHTLSMLASRSIGIFIQASYFTIVARTLGVRDYGVFVGISAFISLLRPFSGWGFDAISIENVSRNKALFSRYWGNALFVSLVSGTLLTILATWVGSAFLFENRSLLVILLIAVAELIFYRIYQVSVGAFNSVELIHQMAKLGLMFRITGLVAALCLSSFFSTSGIIAWSSLYLATRVIAALWSLLLVWRTLGRPTLDLSLIGPNFVKGFYFSIGASSATIYNDIDKSMLATMATPEATGIYGAAYRIVTVAVTPVFSLLASTYTKFFQQGKDGIGGSLKLAKRLVPITGVYGAAASAGLIIFAPLLPQVLGDEYSNSVAALRWLAPLIFLKSIQHLAADTLTGAGFQGIRSTIQVIIAAFNTIANFWLIPLYSWKGAVWSSLASDGLLVLILWVIAFSMSKRHSGNTS